MREGNYGRKDRRISRGGRGAPHPAVGRGLRRLIFTGCGAVMLLCGALLLLR